MIFNISVFVDEKYREKNIDRKLSFLHVFSDAVFHIIFDNVLLKHSVQISRYFINFYNTLSHAAQ